MSVFNEIDKVSLDELTPELRQMILGSSGSAEEISGDLQTHIQNTVMHTTQEEKNYWNNKAPIDSPYFIGTPKAPTPEQGTNSDIIATTRFVTLYINSLDVENATTAEKLLTPIAISLTGKARSETLVTDLSSDVAINVTQIDATAITGTIQNANLSGGTYDISITGTAANANTVGNMRPDQFAPINSPAFTGTPVAPTPGNNDNSTRLATTQFVNNKLQEITTGGSIVVETAHKLQTAQDVFVTGVASGQSVAPFDGTSSLTINITDVEGTLTEEQISKLDSVEQNANYYIHPENHPASMITGLANVATSGSYLDLINTPDLSVYVTTSSLNQVLQGYTTEQELEDALNNYTTNTLNTTLQNYVTNDSLTTTLEDYSTTEEITNTLANYTTNESLNQTLNNYVTSEELAEGTITINLDYDKLQNKPDLTVYAKSADLATVATTGSYTDLINTPDLSVYATTESVNNTLANYVTNTDLTDSLASYYTKTDIDNTLFDYAEKTFVTESLERYPTNNDLTTILKDYVTSEELAGGTVTINLDYNDLQNKPDLSVYALNNNLPTDMKVLYADNGGLDFYFKTTNGDVKTSVNLALASNCDTNSVGILTGGQYETFRGTSELYLHDLESNITNDAIGFNYLVGNEDEVKSWNIPAATATSIGLMSAADKAALDNLNELITSETGDLVTDSIQTGSLTVAGDTTIAGNLTVNGDTYTVNSENVNVKDNMITLNSGEVGAGVTKGSAGVTIDRGTEPDYQIMFDETDDLFKIGQEGDLEVVATREYVTEQLDGLATVAKTGSYNDLVDTPDLSNYVTSDDLAGGTVTINLDYNDLQNKPDLSVYATKDVATTSANGLMSSEDKTKLNSISVTEEGNIEIGSDITLPETATFNLGSWKIKVRKDDLGSDYLGFYFGDNQDPIFEIESNMYDSQNKITAANATFSEQISSHSLISSSATITNNLTAATIVTSSITEEDA